MSVTLLDAVWQCTDRGFVRGDFHDRNGDSCSVQESSLATEDCIWLGLNHEQAHHVTGEPSGARMHLTREMAADLIDILQRFVDTGNLGKSYLQG